MPFMDPDEFKRITENQSLWKYQYEQKKLRLRKIRNILQKRHNTNAHLSREQIADELRAKMRLDYCEIETILNKYNFT